MDGDSMDGKTGSGLRDINIYYETNIDAGGNVRISLEEEIEVKALKNIVDDNEEFSQQERNDLKERIDKLEEEVDKKNADGILNMLERVKGKGELFWAVFKYVSHFL